VTVGWQRKGVESRDYYSVSICESLVSFQYITALIIYAVSERSVDMVQTRYKTIRVNIGID